MCWRPKDVEKVRVGSLVSLVANTGLGLALKPHKTSKVIQWNSNDQGVVRVRHGTRRHSYSYGKHVTSRYVRNTGGADPRIVTLGTLNKVLTCILSSASPISERKVLYLQVARLLPFVLMVRATCWRTI